MAGEGASSADRVSLLWDDGMLEYTLGGYHPMSPVRTHLTHQLIHQTGLIGDGVVQTAPGDFDENELLRRHRPDFVDTVRRLSVDPRASVDAAYGFSGEDTPAFAGMHATSMLICAASKEAARQVWEGEADHAFNPAGGLHHAMPDRAAGFCVYNDPAIAIDWLLENGAERVCYLDVDVHHGDGVEVMFANDPRVLTISLHESGQYLFPGTGGIKDIGEGKALGSIANLPMLPQTIGPVWLEIFDAVVEPLVRGFDPDVLVTQLGCDSHTSDPLAHLDLTVDDMAAIYHRLHRLAHETADGKWVAMGGGGYQLVSVVPRAWTMAFAEMAGRDLPVEIPMAWRELAYDLTEIRPPRSFTEDPVKPADEVLAKTQAAADEVVTAARRLVLPRHGVH